MKQRIQPRALVWAVLVLGLVVPALTVGDTIRLSDGTVLRGRVLSLGTDTLSFETSFGSRVRIARDHIVSIEFTDSLPPQAPRAVAPAAVGSGDSTRIVVSFKDRRLSSKIRVVRHQNESELLRANWIAEVLIVDGDTAFAYVDSVMDKTIYKGPERIYKNTIEIVDIAAKVPGGTRNVSVSVRNVGIEGYLDAFDGTPVNLEVGLGTVELKPGGEYRFQVGISKGKLRMGRPELYLVE